MSFVSGIFFEEVKSFISNHKVLCVSSLGVVVAACTLGNLAPRLVSWICECIGTTKKIDVLSREQLALLESQSKATKEILKDVLVISENYPFDGFRLPKKEQAASANIFESIWKGNMSLKTDVKVAGIGNVRNCYIWNQTPSLEADVPDCIKNAVVRLPKEVKALDFQKMRNSAQQEVISGKGIGSVTAQALALKLGGIVIEATLPYRASNLLDDEESDVEMHCIFQTGLNFGGVSGGGVPLTDVVKASKNIERYYKLNAEAALNSAINNKSDVLVFNIGIGTGFFGGDYKDQVKQANVNGICSAVLKAKGKMNPIEVVVPEIGFSSNQRQQLGNAGISIVEADKDAVAALCARKGLKVSVSIAGDPMSMLGIHGPGFWWETVGVASDEERAAYLTPCYAIGHIPIDIHEIGKPLQRIAALSQFMTNSKNAR